MRYLISEDFIKLLLSNYLLLNMYLCGMKPTPSFYTIHFWLLCLSNFLFSASFQMMLPELPNYFTKMGGKAYIGLIIALFTLTAGLAKPFAGKLADTIGRIPVMAFGSLICFVCGLLYPAILSVNGFLLLRLIHGFSTGTKPTATAAYIADIIPSNRRGEAMGMLGIFTATGMSLGPSIGGWLTNDVSINVMFYVSSGFALMSIMMLMQLKDSLQVKRPFSWQLFRLTPNEIFEPSALPPFIVFLFQSFSTGVVLTLVPDQSVQLGIANKGTFFTVYTLASLLIRLFFSRTSDRHGRLPVLMVFTVVLAIGMSVLAEAQTPITFFGAAILFGCAWGMNAPTIQAWTADLSHESNRGTAMATTYIAIEIGIGLGAYFAGKSYNHFEDGLRWSMHGAGLMAWFAVAYMTWYMTAKKKNVV